jgi:hypothetical protein
MTNLHVEISEFIRTRDVPLPQKDGQSGHPGSEFRKHGLWGKVVMDLRRGCDTDMHHRCLTMHIAGSMQPRGLAPSWRCSLAVMTTGFPVSARLGIITMLNPAGSNRVSVCHLGVIFSDLTVAPTRGFWALMAALRSMTTEGAFGLESYLVPEFSPDDLRRGEARL